MIRLEKLGVSYGKKQVLRDVTFEVPRGSVTAIVGPSGCGKTSLLSALNRMTDLIPQANVTGSAVIAESDIYAPNMVPTELRKRVGMIFQKPNPFPQSVRRNIQLALREHGLKDKGKLNEVTRRVLEDVGLWQEVAERLDESAELLSGGQQQRLCIGRALALEPQVLLMDEPCSSLDPVAAGVVEELIADLRGRYTIVIVTHNLAQARRVADRMAVFWLEDGAGTLIEEGPTDQLFTAPQHPITEAYLRGTRG